MMAVLAAVSWLLALVAGGGQARAERVVDLELVLAVDVSWSMDLDEQRLQRDGYVAALRDPNVWRAIRLGTHGSIALVYVEWAGQLIQQVTVPWTLIDSEVALESFAGQLENTRISRERMTSISGAIAFSAQLFGTAGWRGIRRVIDVSGDGPNNSGSPVEPMRDEIVKRGIVINGLPIMLKSQTRSGYFDISKLDAYYKDCVIGGPGAFVVPVRSKEEFAPAIRRKLILEISGLMPAPADEAEKAPRIIPAQATEPLKSDCLIGERLWQIYMNGRFRE